MSFLRFILGINWKTTAASILPLCTAIDLVVTAISQGHLPALSDLMVIGSFVSFGLGLIAAKDRGVTGGTISNVTGQEGLPVSLVDTFSAITAEARNPAGTK